MALAPIARRIFHNMRLGVERPSHHAFSFHQIATRFTLTTRLCTKEELSATKCIWDPDDFFNIEDGIHCKAQTPVRDRRPSKAARHCHSKLHFNIVYQMVRYIYNIKSIFILLVGARHMAFPLRPRSVASSRMPREAGVKLRSPETCHKDRKRGVVDRCIMETAVASV